MASGGRPGAGAALNAKNTSGRSRSLVTVAALFEDGIHKINLRDYPANDKDQPDYLNISRFATPAQLLDLAKRRTQVKILKKRGAK